MLFVSPRRSRRARTGVLPDPRLGDNPAPNLRSDFRHAGASGRLPPGPIPGAWEALEASPDRRSAGALSASAGSPFEAGTSARKETGSGGRSPRKAPPARSPAGTTPDRAALPAALGLPVREAGREKPEAAGAADPASQGSAGPALFSYVPYPPWVSPRSTLFPG